MSDEIFDDGLVHSHFWASSEHAAPIGGHPIAAIDGARTPSTTVHDDVMFAD